ncbi:16S rRNA (guanine(966)-N(2))-methyltransferase RsmD [uncultured Propionibacterium sp.]|uniref:16S rRNA (guanine(966)-N(2))-methyltransferase RsmD n=1 Tax=uncultured Propionibacterium sp. TaxID=218066 RepID=UPI002930012E|nr:16S rRNA (guanine(966)-N(2))-methyltransferase RsmD [uncultured Propionibacterium sp.]
MGRIIAGSARGARLAALGGGLTRPTADRVREALFSALAAWNGSADEPVEAQCGGLAVLDVFAGSGAMGLEAASRGAGPVHLVERDRRAAGVIRRNISSTGLHARLHVRDAAAFLAGPAPVTFDVIVADPPYALPNDELTGLLQAAADGGFLAGDGMLVVERSGRDPEPAWPDGFELSDRRGYGETALYFCRPVRR